MITVYKVISNLFRPTLILPSPVRIGNFSFVHLVRPSKIVRVFPIFQQQFLSLQQARATHISRKKFSAETFKIRRRPLTIFRCKAEIKR